MGHLIQIELSVRRVVTPKMMTCKAQNIFFKA